MGWVQIVIFCAVLLAIVPLLGGYMARVFTYEARRPQSWKAIRVQRHHLLVAVVAAVLFVVLRTRMPWDLSFNTTSSFVTNTNWQYYAGETTLTGFIQMVGLAVQNFVSAAVGLCVAIVLIRGIAGRPLGNFFEDLTRAVLRILLPISVVGALVLASQGVVQSLDLPVASQEIIKVLGTNGGGFFNVNSAMPFENPNGLTNFLEMLAMLAIPAALTFTYGRMVGSPPTGLGDLRRDVRAVRDRRRRRVPRGVQADARPAGRRAHRREPGGQGAALRHGRHRAVDRDHDRDLDRRGQLRASSR